MVWITAVYNQHFIYVSIWASWLTLDCLLRTEVLINQGAPRRIWKVPEFISCSRCRWAIHPAWIRVAKCLIASWQPNKRESLVTTSCCSWINGERNTPMCGITFILQIKYLPSFMSPICGSLLGTSHFKYSKNFCDSRGHVFLPNL